MNLLKAIFSNKLLTLFTLIASIVDEVLRYKKEKAIKKAAIESAELKQREYDDEVLNDVNSDLADGELRLRIREAITRKKKSTM